MEALLRGTAVRVGTLSEVEWVDLLAELQKRALRMGQTYYFVVDGLADIPEDDHRSLEAIVKGILPIGIVNGFKFLFSGERTRYAGLLPDYSETREYPLAKLSREESRVYLDDLNLASANTDALCRMCDYQPGRLAAVRRLLNEGVPVSDILSAKSDSLPEFLSLEWARAGVDGHRRELVALLAFCRHACTVADLARITRSEPSVVSDELEPVSFIWIDPSVGEISFQSEAHRRLAQQKLADLRTIAVNAIVRDLSDTQSKGVDSAFLPDYLANLGRHQDLVQQLSVEFLGTTIERTQSLSAARQSTELGLRAALALNEPSTILRFAAQGSVLDQLAGSDVSRNEIETRMALGDDRGATALAHTAATVEDRLRLLAMIGRIQCENRGLAEPALVEQVRSLCSQVDPKTLGLGVIEIASHILVFEPRLALELLESGRSPFLEAYLNEWKLNRDFAGSPKWLKQELTTLTAFQKTLEREADPEMKRLAASVGLLLGNCTAQEAMDMAMEIPPSRRIFLLRKWCLVHEDEESAHDLIGFALDELLSLSSYTPTTLDLAELARPVPALKDVADIRRLVDRFDGTMAMAAERGPEEEHVRLHLILAKAECRFDLTAARRRLEDIWFRVEYLDDAVSRACCSARLNGWLASSKCVARGGDWSTLEEDTPRQLSEALNAVIESTANDDDDTGPILEALLEHSPEGAIAFALRLNTQRRRDEALITVVRELASSVTADALDTTITAIRSFVDEAAKDAAILWAVRGIHQCPIEACIALQDKVMELLRYALQIAAPAWKCEACAHAYALLSSFPETKDEESARYRDACEEAWTTIDPAWAKKDLGFLIARSCSQASDFKARKYLEWGEQPLNGPTTADSANAFLAILDLAIRAFGGLVRAGLSRQDDMESLAILIERVPSKAAQSQLWARLALRCAQWDRLDILADVTRTRVQPLLNALRTESSAEWASALPGCLAALYLYHKDSAIELLQTVSPQRRDQACYVASAFLTKGVCPGDPWIRRREPLPRLLYERARDVVDILRETDSDDVLYTCLRDLIENIVDRRARHAKLNIDQRKDIAYRLQEIVTARLPDSRNIKHPGYAILANAQISRLLLDVDRSPAVWQDYVESAEQISNVSDRVLTLSALGEMLHPVLPKWRNLALDTARRSVNLIPSVKDRLDRTLSIADAYGQFNPELTKQALRSAMRLTSESGGRRLSMEEQRTIVSMAYRENPELARELVDQLDQDPARTDAKRQLDLEMDKLTYEDSFKTGRGQLMGLENRPLEVGRAAWDTLGGLNSGQVSPVAIEDTLSHLQFAATLPFAVAYPILSWILENSLRRCASERQAAEYIPKMFEACLYAAGLAARVFERSGPSVRLAVLEPTGEDGDELTTVIGANERERGLAFIRDWFARMRPEEAIICDPYFTEDSLDVVHLLASESAECRFLVITGRTRGDKRDAASVQQDWGRHWRNSYGATPPRIEVTVVESASKKAPWHDRWILLESSGLWLGQSLNGLGRGRSTMVRVLDETERDKAMEKIRPFVERSVDVANGQPVVFHVFKLS